MAKKSVDWQPKPLQPMHGIHAIPMSLKFKSCSHTHVRARARHATCHWKCATASDSQQIQQLGWIVHLNSLWLQSCARVSYEIGVDFICEITNQKFFHSKCRSRNSSSGSSSRKSFKVCVHRYIASGMLCTRPYHSKTFAIMTFPSEIPLIRNWHCRREPTIRLESQPTQVCQMKWFSSQNANEMPNRRNSELSSPLIFLLLILLVHCSRCILQINKSNQLFLTPRLHDNECHIYCKTELRSITECSVLDASLTTYWLLLPLPRTEYRRRSRSFR